MQLYLLKTSISLLFNVYLKKMYLSNKMLCLNLLNISTTRIDGTVQETQRSARQLAIKLFPNAVLLLNPSALPLPKCCHWDKFPPGSLPFLNCFLVSGPTSRKSQELFLITRITLSLLFHFKIPS